MTLPYPKTGKALKPLVRFSGGTPNGYPDFVPLNPWGRGMPKVREEPRPGRYQVMVKDRRVKADIAIGPKQPFEGAEMLRVAIAEQIKLGRELRWADPAVVMVRSEKPRLVLEGV